MPDSLEVASTVSNSGALSSQELQANQLQIDSDVADDFERSVIREQVELGVAVRMAVLEVLAQNNAASNAKGGGS